MVIFLLLRPAGHFISSGGDLFLVAPPERKEFLINFHLYLKEKSARAFEVVT
jgi:hypothetical protein